MFWCVILWLPGRAKGSFEIGRALHYSEYKTVTQARQLMKSEESAEAETEDKDKNKEGSSSSKPS